MKIIIGTPRHWFHILLVFAVTLTCAAAFAHSDHDHGTDDQPDRQPFSQLPAFDDIRAGLGEELPDARARKLLECHQPVLHVAPDEEGPIDFYADYIASGVLFDGASTHIDNPDAAQLNAVRDNYRAVFSHHPAARQAELPAVYGGWTRATLTLTNGDEKELEFLSYHFVFRHSGLPAGISPAYRKMADMVGDSKDWHQLDHYTAAFVVLHRQIPFAVILQQHNYMRTYFLPEDPAFADGIIALDAASSSNELYPHRAGRQERRAAGWLSKRTVGYLTGQQEGGFFTAPDITFGDGEPVRYDLQFLPPNDAFYTFEGRLGEPRRLPGRNGPPGAIYRTLPGSWDLHKAVHIFYWTDQDPEYAGIYQAQGETPEAQPHYLRRFSEKFLSQYPQAEARFAGVCAGRIPRE